MTRWNGSRAARREFVLNHHREPADVAVAVRRGGHRASRRSGRQVARVAPTTQELQAEVRRLRAQLQSVTNQRDILSLNRSTGFLQGASFFQPDLPGLYLLAVCRDTHRRQPRRERLVRSASPRRQSETGWKQVVVRIVPMQPNLDAKPARSRFCRLTQIP